MSSFFKCGFFLYLITVATEWRDQQQNITGWCKIPDFSWFIYILTKKWRNFQVPYFIFSYSRTFPVFKDPWEPCIKVYRNALGCILEELVGANCIMWMTVCVLDDINARPPHLIASKWLAPRKATAKSCHIISGRLWQQTVPACEKIWPGGETPRSMSCHRRQSVLSATHLSGR